jgi:hypothetical protein
MIYEPISANIDPEFDAITIPTIKELLSIWYGNPQTYEGRVSLPINYGEGSQHGRN